MGIEFCGVKEPLHFDPIPVEDMRYINAICTSLGAVRCIGSMDQVIWWIMIIMTLQTDQ